MSAQEPVDPRADVRIDSTRALLARHRGRVVLAIGLLLATMAAGIALLGVSGGFLTAAALTFGVAGTFNFFTPSAGIRGLTLARIVSRYLEKLVGHDTLLRIARDLRVWFFARALRLSPGQLARLRTGELLSRLLGDIDAVDGLLLRATGPLYALLGIGVATVAAALWLHPPTGLWLAGAGLVIGAGVPWIVARGRAAAETRRAQQRADLRARLHELHEGNADLAALGAGAAWLDAVAADSRALAAAELARRRQLVDGNALHGAVAAVTLLGVLWIVCNAAATGNLAPHYAAALFFLAVGLLEVWAGAGLAWQALLAARASIARLDAVAGTQPSVVDPPAPVAVPAHGALTFAGVGFAWEAGGRRVLDGLDLVLAPGERIAISGDSGEGKSTLSALVLRSADPQAGTVTWGGVDLRAMRQADWHARLAWLPQNAPVFAGSVRDNLAFGAPHADDDALWAMLARVRLEGWTRRIGGLDAWVGENGATMSAGQARRLALARALLRAAPLVLLDEPTEGLDHDTADTLLRDLPTLLDGRSLLLITHGALPPGLVHRHLWLRGGRLAEIP
ncbi:thiol reductant ABC exporter subunit CydC [Luteimonas sp. BDR2-5]|uniref:thiol reductant ABC exporter subunit CydC n=1 Tax=Proluteimonas luteida TaxID=2878685 RepID=UPI001E492C68|nr:thiol reductant ABC exporter subunit CydC [Luteimonas sp. BDR2-5]MCD9029593.1 thiol reductant ABC exporter subunit CydC [Luteimonas sp. BDR2-5]